MKKNQRIEIYEKLIEENGANFQILKALEELHEFSEELIVQLQRENILDRELKPAYTLLEEMADVLICLEQLKYLFNYTDEDLGKVIDWKLKRLMIRKGTSDYK